MGGAGGVRSSRVTRCSTCRAPIVWFLTRNGRKMPLDAVEVDDGDFVIVDDVAQRVPPFTVLDPDVQRFTSHFVTCPDRDLHRQARPTKGGGDQ